jgi:predicted molibdopterin-dependent oxidoreductase YjgC
MAAAQPGAGAGDFAILLDGRAVPAAQGSTVGAALTAAGVRSWRTTRREARPRGLFCGIGVCFDCLVTVDGRPNQRACLVPARPGQQVSTQDGVGRGDDR